MAFLSIDIDRACPSSNFVHAHGHIWHDILVTNIDQAMGFGIVSLALFLWVLFGIWNYFLGFVYGSNRYCTARRVPRDNPSLKIR